jgi:hypothetical protein
MINKYEPVNAGGNGPLIFLPKDRPDRVAKKKELSSVGICRKCNKAFAIRVQRLAQHERPDTESQDEETRAYNLFAEYKQKQIGPCCMVDEHRKAISKAVDLIVYNDFSESDLARLRLYL